MNFADLGHHQFRVTTSEHYLVIYFMPPWSDLFQMPLLTFPPVLKLLSCPAVPHLLSAKEFAAHFTGNQQVRQKRTPYLQMHPHLLPLSWLACCLSGRSLPTVPPPPTFPKDLVHQLTLCGWLFSFSHSRAGFLQHLNIFKSPILSIPGLG